MERLFVDVLKLVKTGTKLVHVYQIMDLIRMNKNYEGPFFIK